MRTSLVIANWKMNGERSSNRSLLEALLPQITDSRAECVVCASYVYLDQVAGLLKGSKAELGAQDCSHSDKGAYTGEVSAPMLSDLGCAWVILGHSERRQYHQESDSLVAAKLAATQRAGLTPVVCVGETREQREAGEAQSVVSEQLTGALADLPDIGGVVIAYEPVWAIGTGLTATPEEAQAMHAHIRDVLRQKDGSNADATRILYGGSVKAGNASELFSQADIDGALVGGASLDADAFAAIVNAG